MMSFLDQLTGRNVLPPPPLGVGRVHRFLEDEDIPPQAERFSELLAAIKDGARSVSKIAASLSFKMSRVELIADLDELVHREVIAIQWEGNNARYVPAGSPDQTP